MFSLDIIGALLICASTLMIFSFLYRDNPLYKFAEHVFVGVSAGYGVVMVWTQVLTPNLWDRLWIPESVLIQRMFLAGEISPAEYTSYDPGFADQLGYTHWIYLLFLVLGIMMLFKVTKRLHWVSRWPLAYVIGAFAGIQVIQAAQGSLVPQLQATMKDFSGREIVEELLTKSDAFPALEMEARRVELQQHFSAWYGDRAGTALMPWVEEELLADAGNSRLFRDMPRAFFRELGPRVAQVVEDARSFEMQLCNSLGGESLDRALLTRLGGMDPADPMPLPSFDEWLGADGAQVPLPLPALELPAWQDELYGLLLRVHVENLPAETALAKRLQENGLSAEQARDAADALTRPAGRSHFWELYKAGAFAPGTTLDWNDQRTVVVVDSLLKSRNPRPEQLRNWTSEQVEDLRARLDAAGQGRSLQEELELRLGSLDALLLGEYHLGEDQRLSLQRLVLAGWLSDLPRQALGLHRRVLSDGAALFTGSKLLTSYSDEEIRAFRAEPFDMPALVEGLEDGTASRFGRFSQGLLGLVGMDLQNPSHNLGLRIFIEILSNLLVVVGVCTGVFYFFFSKKQTGGLGVVSKIGIAFLMMSFGASFGYTVMGRISLAIGRMQDLLIYPKIAVGALVVIILALAVQGRREQRSS